MYVSNSGYHSCKKKLFPEDLNYWNVDLQKFIFTGRGKKDLINLTKTIKFQHVCASHLAIERKVIYGDISFEKELISAVISLLTHDFIINRILYFHQKTRGDSPL